jgi:hypothetical protein
MEPSSSAHPPVIRISHDLAIRMPSTRFQEKSAPIPTLIA